MKKSTELTPLEKWNNLTFADNFIFCKVMESEPEICKEMLELLLDIKIDYIEILQSERTMKIDFDSKGIRLDVFVKEKSGRTFDIEVQTSVAKKLSLAKRSRYYQGLMDVDSVFSGENYSELAESYVIFLCLGDVFGKGLPVYSFENICAENQEIKMNDGAHKVFFNAKMYDRMKDEKLKSFFKYLCENESDSNFSQKISKIVNRVKLNARWRHEYMFLDQEIKFQAELRAEEMAQDMAQDLAKNMAQNMAKDIAQNMAQELAEQKAQVMAQEKVIETARNLIEMNLTPEQVSKGTNLPLEQVLELKKQMELK